MKYAKLEPGKSNRILIIHTDGNTYNNPSLKCLIDLLLSNGYQIDLRYPSSFAPMPVVNKVKLLPYGRLVRGLKRFIYNQLCSRFLMHLAVFSESIMYYRNYDLIVGVDRQGLLEAYLLHRVRNTPYLFISFEIFFEEETSARYKSVEKIASKEVSYWIVQDNERATQLKRENGLSDRNKILLPLASAGSGVVSDVRLRDILSIPKDKKVAIAIGSVSTWAMTSEIIHSVRNWPSDWVLILHERYGMTSQALAQELDDLDDLIGKSIYISDSASEMVDDMSMILSGIDAGLAFYKPDFNGSPYTGKNLKFLGLASGKISTYLRYGVPIVSNEIGMYADEIRKYNLGVVVSSVAEISNALYSLEGKGLNSSINHYYSKFLDFNNYADKLLATVKSVIASH